MEYFWDVTNIKYFKYQYFVDCNLIGLGLKWKLLKMNGFKIWQLLLNFVL